MDHIHPVSKGGSNDSDNLITACASCNLGKSDNLLSAIPLSLEEKAAMVAEREDQIAGYEEVIRGKRERLDEQMWECAELWMVHFRRDSIKKDYLASVRSFVDRLGCSTVMECIDLAARRKPYSETVAFKYFCGICWNKIRDGERR